MSRITTCPHCSTRLNVPEGITDKTMICPHCLADIDNPQSGFQIRAADIDTDVRRDLRGGSIVLAVLIGLCVLGIAIELLSSVNFVGEAGIAWSFLMMVFFAGLDVLVSIAFVRGLIRWRMYGVRGGPSVGRVFGIMFLSLGTIAAVCIFFFTCWGLIRLKS